MSEVSDEDKNDSIRGVVADNVVFDDIAFHHEELDCEPESSPERLPFMPCNITDKAGNMGRKYAEILSRKSANVRRRLGKRTV